jgi:hypothetical protein
MQWLFIGSGVIIVTILSFALLRIKPNLTKLIYLLPLLCVISGVVIVIVSKVYTLESMQSLAVLVVGLLSLEIGIISLIVVYLIILIVNKRRPHLHNKRS